MKTFFCALFVNYPLHQQFSDFLAVYQVAADDKNCQHQAEDTANPIEQAVGGDAKEQIGTADQQFADENQNQQSVDANVFQACSKQ